MLAGEAPANLCREFGVSAAAVSKRFGKQKEISKKAGEDLARAQLAVAALPPAARRAATLLADKLVSISEKMADGCEHAASTFVGLKSMANAQFLKIDTVNPLKDAESILAFKTLAAITEMANKVAVTPMNLLAANKEAFRHGDTEGAGVIRLVNDPDAD